MKYDPHRQRRNLIIAVLVASQGMLETMPHVRIDWTVANHLIGRPNIAALRISGLGEVLRARSVGLATPA
jgi:hypothetical protein